MLILPTIAGQVLSHRSTLIARPSSFLHAFFISVSLSRPLASDALTDLDRLPFLFSSGGYFGAGFLPRSAGFVLTPDASNDLARLIFFFSPGDGFWAKLSPSADFVRRNVVFTSSTERNTFSRLGSSELLARVSSTKIDL
jgi:hypothetical protein